MIRAVIFDCFGVLISDALEAMCQELRTTDPAAADTVRELIARSNLGLADQQAANEQVAAVFGMSYEAYRERVVTGEVRNAALFDYILQLRPIYKIAMLSNAGKDSMPRRFSPDELERYFDAVMVSAVIGYAKPDPQAYLLTAERLGVQPTECVFVDDRSDYTASAQAVGMRTILYANFSQFQAELEQLLTNPQ